MNAPTLRLVPSPGEEARTTIIENGCYRVMIGEHPEEIYLAVGNAKGSQCMFVDPRTALRIAEALTVAAAKAIERQFQRQLERS